MIGLFVVQEEGGRYEPVGPLTWLTSDAPIWGFRILRGRFIYDAILKALGFSPWRWCAYDPREDAGSHWLAEARYDAWARRWVSALEDAERAR